MADYKLAGPDQSFGVYDQNGTYIPNDTRNKDWRQYLDWVLGGGVPDPQYSVEEQAQLDYADRQNQRIESLKNVTIKQFEMILALFQVGRDKGLWTTSDFDPTLVAIAQNWIDLIDEYNTDSPGS